MLKLQIQLLFIVALVGVAPLQAHSFPDSFIQLEPGARYQGQLEENAVMRFYFELDREMSVVLESQTSRKRSNQVYPGAVLFNADGEVITRDRNSGQGRNFRISEDLAAGTYVLRVEDERGCGSLHGCPEIIKDFTLTFKVEEVTPF